MAPRRGSNGEGEKNKPEMRRFRSALTWNPPRKRTISPQGGAIRCKSPHLCRNAAAGRSMTPENRGRSPTMQEKLARWPRVDSPEKERLSRAWNDGAGAAPHIRHKGCPAHGGREGLKCHVEDEARVKEITVGLREILCDSCWQECRCQEREQCEERSVRAPSTDREQRGPQPNK